MAFLGQRSVMLGATPGTPLSAVSVAGFTHNRATSQPQGQAYLDRSNPITRDLLIAANGGSPGANLVANTGFRPGEPGAMSEGAGFVSTGVFNTGWTFKTPRKYVSACHALVVTHVTGRDSYAGLFGGVRDDGNSNPLFAFGDGFSNPGIQNSNLYIVANIHTFTDNSSAEVWRNNSIPANEFYGNRPRIYQAGWDSAANGGVGRVWIDQKEYPNLMASGYTQASNWGSYTAAPNIGIGNSIGRSPLFLLWERALSEAEAVSMARNPWQIFSRSPQPIWVPA